MIEIYDLPIEWNHDLESFFFSIISGLVNILTIFLIIWNRTLLYLRDLWSKSNATRSWEGKVPRYKAGEGIISIWYELKGVGNLSLTTRWVQNIISKWISIWKMYPNLFGTDSRNDNILDLIFGLHFRVPTVDSFPDVSIFESLFQILK